MLKKTVKERTLKQLKDEASNVMKEARRKQKALLKKAKEVETQKLSELGKKAIEFLNGNCEIDDLKKVATMNDLITRNSENNESSENE